MEFEINLLGRKCEVFLTEPDRAWLTGKDFLTFLFVVNLCLCNGGLAGLP